MASDYTASRERSLEHDPGVILSLGDERIPWNGVGGSEFIRYDPVVDTMISKIDRLSERFGNRSQTWKLAGVMVIVAGFTAICMWQHWGWFAWTSL
jgi:hypothetical protein